MRLPLNVPTIPAPHAAFRLKPEATPARTLLYSDGIGAASDFASVTSGSNAEIATALTTTTPQPMTLYQRKASAVYFQQAKMTS